MLITLLMAVSTLLLLVGLIVDPNEFSHRFP
jgi:hypothetical protein